MLLLTNRLKICDDITMLWLIVSPPSTLQPLDIKLLTYRDNKIFKYSLASPNHI